MINVNELDSQLLGLDDRLLAREEPGAYMFQDMDGDILYIGASINIRRRLIERACDGWVMSGSEECFRGDKDYHVADDSTRIKIYYTINHHYLERQLYFEMKPLYNTQVPRVRPLNNRCRCHTCTNKALFKPEATLV